MAIDPLKALRARRPNFGDKTDQIEARLRRLIAAGALEEGSIMTKVSRRLPEIASVTFDAIAAVSGEERVDFSLVVWTEGRFQYISTANRDDVASALRLLLAGWEAGMPDVAAHEVV